MQTNARFRIPIEPLIILFSIDGIRFILNKLYFYENN